MPINLVVQKKSLNQRITLVCYRTSEQVHNYCRDLKIAIYMVHVAEPPHSLQSLTEASPSLREESLSASTLPPHREAIHTVAQLQENVSQLLTLPPTEWNGATLSRELMHIAGSILGNFQGQSSYFVAEQLNAKADDMRRENEGFARTIGSLATALRHINSEFDSLVSYHRYSGEALTKRTEQLFAATLVHILGVCASQTGDVSYLAPLLSKHEGGILFTTYSHISSDLFRTLRDLPNDQREKAMGKTWEIIQQGLRIQILHDIDCLVLRHGLSEHYQKELTDHLDREPQTLPREVARRIYYATREKPRSVEFHSDTVDREFHDLVTFRDYSISGKFIPTVSGSVRPSTLDLFCRSKGHFLNRDCSL